uniref:HDC06974 n=1 Tax=Drosophila melanogaster TaxID=7227 RepID=Q6IG87_DROME|nr:TPA_inf: HDC06974 [Drosophila melanogaster]
MPTAICHSGRGSTGSQISKQKDLKSPKRTRDEVTKKTKKKLPKNATMARSQLTPSMKIKAMIKNRVKMTQKRKLALMTSAKDKPLPLKSKRKVIVVDPSLKTIRPKIARRPTPLPRPRKKRESRATTLPKYIPLCQKKHHVVIEKSSEG